MEEISTRVKEEGTWRVQNGLILHLQRVWDVAPPIGHGHLRVLSTRCFFSTLAVGRVAKVASVDMESGFGGAAALSTLCTLHCLK